jgi:DNA-binding CsgD family transcriptional regulator
MLRLGRSDLDASLRFVAHLAWLAASETADDGPESDGPYPANVLEHLKELVPATAVSYQDLDLRASRYAASAWAGPDDEDEDELYFSLGGCPISAYRSSTGDLRAVRISDIVEPRRYRESALFREYFRPAGFEHLADLGLPAASTHHRSFILFRGTGDRDFSDRDCAVLDLLRPHLLAFETGVALRRRLRQALRGRADNLDPSSAAPEGAFVGLTAREREIVVLVARGKTNAEIAAELWIAPSTVKKHLENVYVKLGVGRRAAAVQLLRAAN